MRLTRPVHASWLIGFCSLGIIIGTALCLLVESTIFADLSILLLAFSILFLCCVRRLAWTIALALCAGCLLGLWRGTTARVELKDIGAYYGQVIQLQGRVSQDASYSDKGDLRLYVSDVRINGKDVAGEVWISTTKVDIKRGDIILLEGMLNEGFGNISASMSRVKIAEIIRPNPGDIARRVRDWFAAGVRAGVPEPQVSLGLGYLVGQKTALPPDLQEDIKTVGLTHVVVASGYNLTILVVFARKLFAGISKYMSAIFSVLMIISFVLITGLSPSMTRAGLVAGLGLLVWYYGRKMHPFVLLSFAAAVTAGINPGYLWGDLGWYLSFGSFIGVIVLAPLLHHYFWGLESKPRLMRQLTIETMSAQIMTMPLILMAFAKYSIYALPANILVLPLVPLAMLFTFIAGIFGLLIPAYAHYTALPATMTLKYSTEVIERLANMPNSQSELSFNPAVMIGSYILICIAMIYLKVRTKHDFRGKGEIDIY